MIINPTFLLQDPVIIQGLLNENKKKHNNQIGKRKVKVFLLSLCLIFFTFNRLEVKIYYFCTNI